jgi:DNA-binding transcriptional MerR regulator
MDVFGAMAALRPPRKLYRVSEIAEHVGVTRQTIHNYATIGLIVEEDRTPGGQRLYDESVFATLARISRLKASHRLTEIRRLLQREAEPEPSVAASDAAGPAGAGGAGSDVAGTGAGPRHGVAGLRPGGAGPAAPTAPPKGPKPPVAGER